MKITKNTMIKLATVALISGFGATSTLYAQTSTETTKTEKQTTAEDVKQETKELLETLKSYSYDKKDEAIKATKAAMDNLDKRIDAAEKKLDDKWDTMTKPAREKARATLKALHKERVELAEWYGGLKHDSGSAWDDVKQGFSNAYSALATAWEKAKKEFESDEEKEKNTKGN